MAETIESLTQMLAKLAQKVEAIRVAEGTNGDRVEKKADLSAGMIKDVKHDLDVLTKRVTELEKAKKK